MIGRYPLSNDSQVLSSSKRVVAPHHASMVLYEHSAAISNIHIDATELITDDYDGIVILRCAFMILPPSPFQTTIHHVPRKLRSYQRFGRMFRRGGAHHRKLLEEARVLS